MSPLHYLRKGGPLHVTAALHVTGGSRSWRIDAPLQMRHAPHATHVSNGAPGLKNAKPLTGRLTSNP
jgi:hypothetical protein